MLIECKLRQLDALLQNFKPPMVVGNLEQPECVKDKIQKDRFNQEVNEKFMKERFASGRCLGTPEKVVVIGELTPIKDSYFDSDNEDKANKGKDDEDKGLRKKDKVLLSGGKIGECDAIQAEDLQPILPYVVGDFAIEDQQTD